MNKSFRYIGINNEPNGAMTDTGKIIRDAWVFEIIPETETCEGWNLGGIDNLHHKVNEAWDKYGCLVSNLPEELLERHKRIHGEWVQKAKDAGWSGELEIDEES